MSYVAKTDKGYIKGDLYSGVTFVKKEDARKFSDIEAKLFEQSMASDMFDFFECSEFSFEENDL